MSGESNWGQWSRVKYCYFITLVSLLPNIFLFSWIIPFMLLSLFFASQQACMAVFPFESWKDNGWEWWISKLCWPWVRHCSVIIDATVALNFRIDKIYILEKKKNIFACYLCCFLLSVQYDHYLGSFEIGVYWMSPRLAWDLLLAGSDQVPIDRCGLRLIC